MEKNYRVRVELGQFIEDSKKLLGNDWPEAITKALELTAKRTEMMERASTREIFKLHSDWIPKNINAFPKTKAQVSKVKNDIKKKGEAYASVSTSDRIPYMSMQEDGGTKTPRGRALAIPNITSGRSFVDSKGRIKKRYQPKTLLEQFNKNAWKKGSKHPGERGSGKKSPFVIMGKGGVLLLVKRKSKKSNPLEILFVFKPKADIKARWHFEERGYNFVKANYERFFEYALQVVVRKYSTEK
jgi:hypothetical protein